MSALRLYDIASEYKFLLEELCDQDGVVNETALSRLNELKDPLETKCINLVRVFKDLDGQREAIEKERKLMAAREKSLKNQVDRLKNYLKENMEKCDINKISCPQFVINLQKNPPAVNMFDFDLIPDEYKKITVELNTQKIKSDLQSGVDIPGANLVQGCSVRIK